MLPLCQILVGSSAKACEALLDNASLEVATAFPPLKDARQIWTKKLVGDGGMEGWRDAERERIAIAKHAG